MIRVVLRENRTIQYELGMFDVPIVDIDKEALRGIIRKFDVIFNSRLHELDGHQKAEAEDYISKILVRKYGNKRMPKVFKIKLDDIP